MYHPNTANASAGLADDRKVALTEVAASIIRRQAARIEELETALSELLIEAEHRYPGARPIPDSHPIGVARATLRRGR